MPQTTLLRSPEACLAAENDTKMEKKIGWLPAPRDSIVCVLGFGSGFGFRSSGSGT